MTVVGKQQLTKEKIKKCGTEHKTKESTVVVMLKTRLVGMMPEKDAPSTPAVAAEDHVP